MPAEFPTPTVDAERRAPRWWLLVLAMALAWRGYGEIAMMREHGPDAQMGIWYWAFPVTMLFWLVMGWIACSLVAKPKPGRGRLPGLLLLGLWISFVTYGGWQYQRGAQALADAANPSTPSERLGQLAEYDGITVGSELENRIAANPNSPAEALRQVYEREPETTRPLLEAYPNTPADVRERLAKHAGEF